MGQKVNPIIIRLGQSYNWNSKYIEKKSSELAHRSFQDLNIRNFLYKILKDNGMFLNNLKIFYKNNSTDIFIEYFLNTKSILQKNLKNKKIKIITKKETKKIQKNKKNIVVNSFLEKLFLNLKLFDKHKSEINLTFKHR